MKMRALPALCLVLCFQQVHSIEITSVSEDYPPFEYVENGKVVGFTVDLLDAIYKKTGHNGNANILPWARAYRMALNEPNILVHRMTRSKAREDLFKWVGKVSDKKVSLFKLKFRNDIQLKALNDAKSYEVGTIRDQSSTKFLYGKGFEEGVNTFSVTNTGMNIKKLFGERVDMVLAMEPILQFWVHKLGHSFDDVEEAVIVDHSSEFHMAFSQQTSDELVEQFRQAMQELKSDGTFDRLWTKHFGS